jgi:hypothetical protein
MLDSVESWKKGGSPMNVDDLLNVEELEIEPITDEILTSVLGGLGEDDGWFSPSCSNTDCSNKPKETES